MRHKARGQPSRGGSAIRHQRAYYQANFDDFCRGSVSSIVGKLAEAHRHDLNDLQRQAWVGQIELLQAALAAQHEGHIYFEFSIPRMGKRADSVLLFNGTVFVLEFKVGAAIYTRDAWEQAYDYALDLKNFHEGSHDLPIVPVLVATKARAESIRPHWGADEVAAPVQTNLSNLGEVLSAYSSATAAPIDPEAWATARYKPTPTIVEAAKALYGGHSVAEISRSDAGAINLTRTADAVRDAIARAQEHKEKTICFVTGVPGSGKTLAGLNLATQHLDPDAEDHAVFLSGNGPLVAVLREALARDNVAAAKARNQKITKKKAAQKANTFIQNIHHFRDDSLVSDSPPTEHVVVFDEAQRAWTKKQASTFMKAKRGDTSFDMSEPEFLLSVMDRHPEWCVVVCLIGGGQEINTGEAGLSEWFAALQRSFSHWRVLYSPRLNHNEYAWGEPLLASVKGLRAEAVDELHLSVSVRSFRAESVSAFVGSIIDGDAEGAKMRSRELQHYPIVLTRDIEAARRWLVEASRGSERYGLVAYSNGIRLKPDGIHVKAQIDPANWFLNGRHDVRSSYALEDVATEFDIQGLELDWVGVCWDVNFRRHKGEWHTLAFRGTSWLSVRDADRRRYLANAYRVLLTRARQGMVIFVPRGSADDPTRNPKWYDETAEFLSRCGIPMIDSPAA